MNENNDLQEEILSNKVSIIDGIKLLIQNVSTSGKYQKKLIFYFLLISFFPSLSIMASNLYYMNPVFHCGGGHTKVFEENACRMLQQCVIINKETITAELELYCDSGKESRLLLQAAFGYGCWLGLLTVSLLGDRIGRKISFAMGVLMLNFTWICQFIGVYLQSISFLFLADFITGFATRFTQINCLIIITRFLNKNAYEMETLALLITYHGLTHIAMAAINQIFENWRAIAFVYIAGILYCSVEAFFVLKEDPIFLFESGKEEEAKRVIQQIGEQNNEDPFKIQENINKLDLIIQRNIGNESTFRLRELLRSDILLNAFLIAFTGFLYILCCKSIELSIQSLNYSYNFNLFIVGVSNVCGFTSAIYITKIEQQRKRGLIYTIVIYGLISLLFLFPFCTENGAVQSFVIFFLRFFLCWYVNFFTRLKVDTFPERYQNTIIGAIDFMISLGFIVTPYIVQKLIEHQLNVILAIGVLRLVIGVIPMFLFKEEKIQINPEETSKDERIQSIDKEQE